MVSSFTDVIDVFDGPAAFARAVGMSAGAAKQARRRDSLAAEWFSATARAAHDRGLSEITEKRLAEIAEAKRTGLAA